MPGPCPAHPILPLRPALLEAHGHIFTRLLVRTHSAYADLPPAQPCGGEFILVSILHIFQGAATHLTCLPSFGSTITPLWLELCCATCAMLPAMTPYASSCASFPRLHSFACLCICVHDFVCSVRTVCPLGSRQQTAKTAVLSGAICCRMPLAVIQSWREFHSFSYLLLSFCVGISGGCMRHHKLVDLSAHHLASLTCLCWC